MFSTEVTNIRNVSILNFPLSATVQYYRIIVIRLIIKGYQRSKLGNAFESIFVK